MRVKISNAKRTRLNAEQWTIETNVNHARNLAVSVGERERKNRVNYKRERPSRFGDRARLECFAALHLLLFRWGPVQGMLHTYSPVYSVATLCIRLLHRKDLAYPAYSRSTGLFAQLMLFFFSLRDFILLHCYVSSPVTRHRVYAGYWETSHSLSLPPKSASFSSFRTTTTKERKKKTIRKKRKE